jgi:hypothetical protein
VSNFAQDVGKFGRDRSLFSFHVYSLYKNSEYAMTKYVLLMIVSLAASPVLAQNEQIDLPPLGDVQNFVPLIAPATILGAVLIVAGGGGNSAGAAGSTN